ncbi:hypothetical protein GCM10027443_17340 [Pontibacter brevis]
MNIKTLLVMTLSVMLAFASTNAFAQTTQASTELQEAKDKADQQRLKEAINLRNDTKADARAARLHAKKARRNDKEAAYTAKHAKRAARMEAKAQRNRAQADKQARKVARATEKPGSN